MERRQHTSRMGVHEVTSGVEQDVYVELVLSIVELIPPGRATTYGDIAEVVRSRCGSGGPRQVGRALALHGGGVAWWRVVRADGSFSTKHGDEARLRHLAEGTALLGSARVDLRRSGWDPSRARPDRL